jgi:hypothetical protein
MEYTVVTNYNEEIITVNTNDPVSIKKILVAQKNYCLIPKNDIPIIKHIRQITQDSWNSNTLKKIRATLNGEAF